MRLYWVKGCGGHLGRHIELQLSAPHLECLPKFFNLLWAPYKDQESKLRDISLHTGPPSAPGYCTNALRSCVQKGALSFWRSS